MKTTCPACGATNSLDALVNHAAASEALKLALDLSAPLGPALTRYLGLFRPAKNTLSFERVAKLINELLPVITAKEIRHKGQHLPAPPDAWVWAIEQAVRAKQEGKLITPLKNHNWLFAVLATYKPKTIESVPAWQPPGNAPPADAAPNPLLRPLPPQKVAAIKKRITSMRNGNNGPQRITFTTTNQETDN